MFIVISTKRKRMERSLDYARDDRMGGARDDRMGGTRDDNGVLGMTGRKGPILIYEIRLFVEDFWA